MAGWKDERKDVEKVCHIEHGQDKNEGMRGVDQSSCLPARVEDEARVSHIGGGSIDADGA